MFFEKLFSCLHHTPGYYGPLDDLLLLHENHFNNRTYFDGKSIRVNLSLVNRPHSQQMNSMMADFTGGREDQVKLSKIIKCFDQNECRDAKIRVFLESINRDNYVENLSSFFRRLCLKVERLSKRYFYFCVNRAGYCYSAKGFGDMMYQTIFY